ncbi:rhamnan synthesis F family protein (plasmid) [Shinella sumterensis]|nr:rhamnan synthesis F family protein [Shinella sumterensis]
MICDKGLTNSPVSVFVHVYYLDIWREISMQIEARLDVPFRLIITTHHDASLIDFPRSPYLTGWVIYPVGNRGRDILPFLKALHDEYGTFEVGLKLHTKRSPHRSDGDVWRRAMIDSLVPQAGVSSLVRLLYDRPEVGLVAPEGFYVPIRQWIAGNKKVIATVAKATDLSVTKEELRQRYFSAGSMFWFRSAALKQALLPSLFSMFEDEESQLDATVAHALERLFALIVEKSGYVAVTADLLSVDQKASPDATLAASGRSGACHPVLMQPDYFWLKASGLLFIAKPIFHSLPPVWRARLRYYFSPKQRPGKQSR